MTQNNRKFINLTGKKINRWTVLKRLPSIIGHTHWLCRCECGKEKSIQRGNLLSGHSQSCGCLRRERDALKYGLASMKRVILGYKGNARKRGLEYNLTEEQFKEIVKQKCYYCGTKPNNIAKNRYYNGDFIYNGLDRIDNSIGYTVDNCVPCCKICNVAKNNYTLKEYKDWIKKSYNYQNNANVPEARGK